jgi:GNAT superfamily N-acetyltransferase
MIVRKAQVGDAPNIAKVHVQSWHETYRGIMPDAVLDSQSVEQRQAMWERVIPEKLAVKPLFVAVHDNEIVGFAAGGAVQGEYEGYDSELYAIYALKAVHGQGIGRKLMAHLAQNLHELGYKALMLWVAKGNPTAGFYAHMGGKPFAEKSETFGATELVEVAYGWSDIRTLLVTEKD